MKILIIGATHGNELLGVKLYARLLQKRSPLLEYVDFIIGNPKAYAAKTRYIEQDLNRSYHSTGSTYEQTRAAEIRAYAEFTKPDIVLDMHTTSCEQPNCLIISNFQGAAKRQFLQACHIETILQVQPMHDITTLGDHVIGYETPNRAVTANLLDQIIGDLQRFVGGDYPHARKRLFLMQDKIYKKDVSPTDAASFVNFQMHQLGFVPIMTGENSYKRQTDYLGFKALAQKDIDLRTLPDS